jgi:hypothetical protein
MELHLDPIGGVAGDMFIAAILDAFPELEEGMLASIRAAGLDPLSVSCKLLHHHEAALDGKRFLVQHHRPDSAAEHDHTAWREIGKRLETSALAGPVKRETTAIFGLLAAAEAKVHGIDPQAVVFHEVGALDSIADIVGAAHLIATLGAKRWSVSPVPLGSGRIETAHGIMPVPAPATAVLIEGFLTQDDGIAGERVTPTGAAILAHLCERPRGPSQVPRVLARSGVGFGARSLPGIGNYLRVLAFEVPTAGARPDHRELAVIEFEIDDQSAEDLATGLDRLRAHEAILEAVQVPVFGKKGRIMTHVRLLARPAAMDAAIDACFRETTTIGLRYRVVNGVSLPRQIQAVAVGPGQVMRVKTVERPGGRTAKAELEDARAGESHAERCRLRLNAERLALGKESAE